MAEENQTDDKQKHSDLEETYRERADIIRGVLDTCGCTFNIDYDVGGICFVDVADDDVDFVERVFDGIGLMYRYNENNTDASNYDANYVLHL